MVDNATFSNISVLFWRSIVLMEDTGENHRPSASQWRTLSHNVVLSTPRHERKLIHIYLFTIKYKRGNPKP